MDYGTRYDHPEMAGREIAGYTPAKQVQALLNLRVRYTYNVEGKENNMIFEIQLITMIPSEGALKIEVTESARVHTCVSAGMEEVTSSLMIQKSENITFRL